MPARITFEDGTIEHRDDLASKVVTDLRTKGYDVGGFNSPVKVAPIDRIPQDQSAGVYDEIREGDLADIRVYGHVRTVRVLKLARKNATIRVTLADGREKTIVRPKHELRRSTYAHLNQR